MAHDRLRDAKVPVVFALMFEVPGLFVCHFGSQWVLEGVRKTKLLAKPT